MAQDSEAWQAYVQRLRARTQTRIDALVQHIERTGAAFTRQLEAYGRRQLQISGNRVWHLLQIAESHGLLLGLPFAYPGGGRTTLWTPLGGHA